MSQTPLSLTIVQHMEAVTPTAPPPPYYTAEHVLPDGARLLFETHPGLEFSQFGLIKIKLFGAEAQSPHDYRASVTMVILQSMPLALRLLDADVALVAIEFLRQVRDREAARTAPVGVPADVAAAETAAATPATSDAPKVEVDPRD